MVIRMDIHTMGSLLDVWREGNSSCYKPLNPTGGQWLQYWEHYVDKPLSLHLKYTYLEVVGVNRSNATSWSYKQTQ